MLNVNFFLLFLILLSASILRIYSLGDRDLWYDEVITVWNSKSLNFAYDLQPPFYYFILHFWIKIFPLSEFNLRILSALFGIASIIIMYFIGKELLNKKVGLLSAFILALSPSHIWYAQEARCYTLFTCLIMLSFYFFILILKENKISYWLYFSVFSILSLYTSYYAFFPLLVEIIAFIILGTKHKSLVKRYIVFCIVILLAFLPWSLIFLRQFKFITCGFWIPKPALRSLFITFLNFNVGYTGTEVIYFSSTVMFLLFVIGVFSLWRINKKTLVLLISQLFAPIIVAFLISLWIPIYIDRQLLAFSPFYYLIIAAGLYSFKKITIKVSFLIIIISLMGASLFNYYLDYMPSPPAQHIGTYTKKPFKPIVKFIKRNLKEGDIIAHSNRGIQFPFKYYWNSDAHPDTHMQYYFIIPEAQDEYWRKVLMKHLKRGDKSIINLNQGLKGINPKRIWLLSSSWARDYTLDGNSKAVRDWMKKNFLCKYETWMDGILIGLYEK